MERTQPRRAVPRGDATATTPLLSLSNTIAIVPRSAALTASAAPIAAKLGTQRVGSYTPSRAQ